MSLVFEAKTFSISSHFHSSALTYSHIFSKKTTLAMDFYFTLSSAASTSAASKPEEIITINQEDGGTGGQGYCTIA